MWSGGGGDSFSAFIRDVALVGPQQVIDVTCLDGRSSSHLPGEPAGNKT